MSGLQAALPREFYTDEQVWRTEIERVWMREWVCIGRRVDLGLDLPEQVAAVDVLGESVLITSDAHRRLHAVYNLCRHRGSQLVPITDPGRPSCAAAKVLRCPYHSWTYALDGRLIRAPHTEDLDPALEKSDFSLHPVEVEEWEGFLFVRLERGTAKAGASTSPSEVSQSDGSVRGGSVGDRSMRGATLREATERASRTLANYAIGSLRTGLVLDYDVAANWKVVAENYNECYHCGPVHPELCRLVPAFTGGGADLDWDAGIEHREGAWTFTTSGTTSRAPLPGLDEAERTRHKGELIYPNLMLSCSADHVAAFRLSPTAVDRTTVECRLLFAEDAVGAADFDPSDAGDLWDLVNRQDWAICESVQRGMTSRAYTGGWFAPMESESADIRTWLLPRMSLR